MSSPAALPRPEWCYDPCGPVRVDAEGVHVFAPTAVREVLTDRRRFGLELGGDPVAERHLTFEFMWLRDGEGTTGCPGDHRRLRRVAAAHVLPAAVPALEPLLRRAAAAAVAELARRGARGTPVDLHRDLGLPYAAAVTGAIVGVPAATAAWMVALQRDHVAADGDLVVPRQPEVDAACEDALTSPPPDTVAATVAEARAAGRLTDREAHAQIWGYLVAGVLTTATSATLAPGLLVHHGAYAPLAQQLNTPAYAAAVQAAADEVLRLGAAFPRAIRVALEDTAVAGVPVARGQLVSAWLAAADRSEEVAGAAPTQFRLDRRGVHATVFGGGAHYCPGAQLARREVAVLVEELHRARVWPQPLPGWRRYAEIEDGFLDAPARLRPPSSQRVDDAASSRRRTGVRVAAEG